MLHLTKRFGLAVSELWDECWCATLDTSSRCAYSRQMCPYHLRWYSAADSELVCRVPALIAACGHSASQKIAPGLCNSSDASTKTISGPVTNLQQHSQYNTYSCFWSASFLGATRGPCRYAIVFYSLTHPRCFCSVFVNTACFCSSVLVPASESFCPDKWIIGLLL